MASETAWKSVVASCILLGMLAPRGVEAGEVNLGGRAGVGYDSDVFSGTNSKTTGSGVLEFQARAEATDELESGTYRFRYEPSYTVNTASRAKNAFNQHALAEGTYVLSPRTQFTLSENFASLQKIVYGVNDPNVPGNIDDSNRETLRNNLTLSGQHMIDPLTTVWGNSLYVINRYHKSNNTDDDYLAGQGGLSRAISPRLQVGGGGLVSYRSFDSPSGDTFCSNNGLGRGPGSRTLSYSGFLTGSYKLDPITNLELRAGPAQLQTVSYVCDPAQLRYLRRQDNQWTWYAEGTLKRQWKRFSAQVSYTRAEGLGGAGTATVNDVVEGRLYWLPARFWTLALRANWIQRNQQGVKQANGVRTSTDTTNYTVVGRVTRQVLKHLAVSLDASFRSQSQHTKGYVNPNTNDFNAYRILVGIDYQYDPIRY